ncbi:MAG: hypothetical protein QM781_00100 [Chitinophagaceae bacterium]
MKRSIKTNATALLLSLGIYTLSFAQGVGAVNPAQTETVSLNAGDNNAGENNAKASFSTLFPNASQQKWTSSDDNSFVSFLNNGRKATASFTAKGKLNYVITDCSMNDLPAAFSKNIKKDYAAYQLFHAIEIKAHGQTAYQVVLENAAGFITLKSTADGIEEIQQVKK